jgi:hypothetical protein
VVLLVLIVVSIFILAISNNYHQSIQKRILVIYPMATPICVT